MIALLLDGVPFEQDVRELFMAFYPGERYTHEPDENAMIVFSAAPAETDPEEKTEIAPEAPEDAVRGAYSLSLTIRGGDGTERTRSFRSARYTERLWGKNALKRALYLALCEENGRTLPWGTLTGIRPTKLALTELEEGISADEVSRHLRERYFLSEEKNSLCVRTAACEYEALRGLDLERGWSLYIGIPFCPTTCLYCSFTSYPVGKWKKETDRYVDALCTELARVAEWMRGRPLETIYMGGGTPTSLESHQLDRILTAVEQFFDLSDLRELTVESGRPDSITEEKLLALKKHRVSRISINPQTMKQETLDLIGRRHTVDQFRECFALARRLGFDNINTDLIVGLPNETADDVRRTMEEIRILAPDDVTIHSLALKRAARLNTKKEDYADVTYGNASDMIALTGKCCEEMGLHPYYLYRQKNMAGNLENVGWCRPGHEGLYNILIMEEKQTIVGCGAGTTTRVVYPGENRYERAENVKDPGLYIERLSEMLARKQELLAPEA